SREDELTPRARPKKRAPGAVEWNGFFRNPFLLRGALDLAVAALCHCLDARPGHYELRPCDRDRMAPPVQTAQHRAAAAVAPRASLRCPPAAFPTVICLGRARRAPQRRQGTGVVVLMRQRALMAN